MHSLAYACAALVGAAATLYGDSKDRVIIAAMTLTERPNYTWVAVIDTDTLSYQIEGKTNSDGLTWVRMPMVTAIGRRIGREHEPQLEALFQANGTPLVRVDNAWHSIASLPQLHERTVAVRSRPMVRGSASSGNFGIASARGTPEAGSALEAGRTGLQFGVTHPHEELAIIVSSFTSMEMVADVVSGTLSETGAALLLVRDDHRQVTPLSAAGTFKLWTQNGNVVRYYFRVEGVVAVPGRKNGFARLASTTTLKDIGTTRLTLPE